MTWLVSVYERFRVLDLTRGRPRLARVPVAALVVVGLVLAAATLTRPLFGQLPTAVSEDFGWSARQVLDGQVWRAVTATVLTRDVFMLASLISSTGALLVVLERIAGRAAALSVWVAGAVWGYLGTTVLLAVGHLGRWDLASRTLDTLDYGPSAGTAAVAAAVVVVMRHRAVTVAVVGVLLVGSAWHHKVADVEHLISFGTVLAAAPLVTRLARSRHPHRVSRGDGGP